MWVARNKAGYWANVVRVLVGRRTWVGYAQGGEGQVQLPPLKPGVVNPISHLRLANLSEGDHDTPEYRVRPGLPHGE